MLTASTAANSASAANASPRLNFFLKGVFFLTQRLLPLLADGASMGQIKQAARKDGLQTLLHSALNKVRDGVTTLDEAFSVCATQSEMFE